MAGTVLEIGKEYPPEGEDAAIEQLRGLHLKVHQAQPGPSHRGEHPKQHAGLWATFRVEDGIPGNMRVGLFAAPRTYTALVRFSNGRGPDDTKPEVHAMAIKVLVPNGDGPPQMQDFIVADHPVFFARNVQHVFAFLAATVKGTPVAQLAATDYPELAHFSSLATTSLLDMTYWSQTPYKLGNGAVKYLVTASAALPGDERAAIALGHSPDCLREALVEQLTVRKIGARFDLCVNPQTDAAAMPVEDPTVEWTSAPVRLATVSLYPQKFDGAEQMAFFESLSWSPWNALPEHTPLGGINRARRGVYEDSSALRHKTTGVAPVHPTGRESF
jgi:Catalase